MLRHKDVPQTFLDTSSCLYMYLFIIILHAYVTLVSLKLYLKGSSFFKYIALWKTAINNKQ